MSQDVLLYAPDGAVWSLDNLSTQKWLEGRVQGARAAAAWLRESAVGLFREGKHAEVVARQKLAAEVSAAVVLELEAAAAEHAAEWPALVSTDPAALTEPPTQGARG